MRRSSTVSYSCPPSTTHGRLIASERVLGSDGTVVARCGEMEWTWQPRVHSGDLSAAIDELVCVASVEGSALETIKRCFAR